MESYDAIIIGGGIGGLVTGALLLAEQGFQRVPFDAGATIVADKILQLC